MKLKWIEKVPNYRKQYYTLSRSPLLLLKQPWTIKTQTPQDPWRCTGVAGPVSGGQVSTHQLVHPAHPTDAPSLWDVLKPNTSNWFALLACCWKRPQNTRDKGKHGLQQRWGCSHVFNDNSIILGWGLAALWFLQTGYATLQIVNCSAAVPCGCNSNPRFVLIYFSERPVSIAAYIMKRRKNRNKVTAHCLKALALTWWQILMMWFPPVI